MKIAILGAGFTGLTVALRLLQDGHEVTIFEKEAQVGGLAGGFKLPEWDWPLEKSYHHTFTNDQEIFKLAKEVSQKMIIKRPKTEVFVNNHSAPLDSPLSVLTFPYLSLINRFRIGASTLYLKTASHHQFQGKTALPWLRKVMGKEISKLIWEPLFLGKFGPHKEKVSLTWFWARIKKRTSRLAYPEGGFGGFADKIACEIQNLGGKIVLNHEITSLPHDFDKIISTLPTPIFTKITPNLPKDYVKKISSIPHLSALNLILVLDKPFLKDTYWLNITDTSFPFLVLAEHTNFMNPEHYGGKHILYIGNYMPSNHPYLKMTPKELLKIYEPFLKKINPNYTLSTKPYTLLFTQPFAQPIVTTNYSELMPDFQTPLKNVYLANLDMVYPWDRGTNYAIELGETIAKIVTA